MEWRLDRVGVDHSSAWVVGEVRRAACVTCKSPQDPALESLVVSCALQHSDTALT